MEPPIRLHNLLLYIYKKKVIIKHTVTSVCVFRSVQQLKSEVVVGALCGCAVLRGAHVFAPGIVASPKCKILMYIFQKNVQFIIIEVFFVPVFLKS